MGYLLFYTLNEIKEQTRKLNEIKEQTRKLAADCSKHCFEVADKTDEVSSKHCFLGCG
ncbi:chlorohydrolase [Streptococcus pneumoniae]|uniref:hypothetical protein n=1 Tax=Streptococcus pneumoniae TaxID=1313 RepID=UPI0005FCF04B|nr:hypothetical protein [Streptococcus pneumoniae]CRD27314.1 chlorohydrolase [Streptococcus pneumoniae]